MNTKVLPRDTERDPTDNATVMISWRNWFGDFQKFLAGGPGRKTDFAEYLGVTRQRLNHWLNHWESLPGWVVVAFRCYEQAARYGTERKADIISSPGQRQAHFRSFRESAAPELPMDPCAACDAPADGSFSVEDDEGNERAVCMTCGGPDGPAVAELQRIVNTRNT